ncbi:hypothetical protein [Carboxylicivirga mesophila]|nr:hypothetical protein [Carboxylicivirga mesophila]
MILLLTLLSFWSSIDAKPLDDFIFELPPNEVSIIDIIDYFDAE